MTDEQYLEKLNIIYRKVVDGKLAAESGRLAWDLLEHIVIDEESLKRKKDR